MMHALLLLALALSSPREPRPMHAVWVTRWDYVTKEDVVRVFESSRQAGFRTVLFQVRGNATVFYPSQLEPWADELGGEDPGYDPLAVALAAARERGLELHAWVNVVPAWWGTAPPRDPAQIVNARPDWLWVDQHGERQSYSERFYVSLNPCLPEVRAYLVKVLEELLSRYAVDGLHLDYIRFPNEPPAAKPGQDFPRDARTLALYAGETELAPDDEPERWERWRAEQVTRLVRDLRAMQRRVRPSAVFSAAVGPEPESARRHHQDWPRWIEEELFDLLLPMNYTPDAERFERRLEAWRPFARRVPVVMGLRIDGWSDSELARRAKLCQADFAGTCLFAWYSLHDSRNEVLDQQTAERRAERAQRRAALLPLLREL